MQIRSIRTILFALVVLSISAAAFAQIGVAITFGPPALPVYEQPICPGEGYIWTPGYWAWGDDFGDYYWVPGTWVEAPEVGFLWTPGYWGWGGDRFVFYEGYWGPQVGFYGGINYGFGYFGNGYEGGRWDNGHFFYNRAVTNVNVTVIHNVYNTTVINRTVNRVSYNGGNGGVNARPTTAQEAAAHERHIAAVSAQTQHQQEARSNPQQRASTNEGKPPVAATDKPGDFRSNVVKAREAGAPYVRPANRGGNQPRANESNSHPENGNSNGNSAENKSDRPNKPMHARDLPPAERPNAPNTGNPKTDQKYQQQQEKQFAKQQQERQKLQLKQDKEDQRVAQKSAEDKSRQQVEQRHQQQTQQLQQRHEQQQQKMQQREQPRERNQPKPQR